MTILLVALLLSCAPLINAMESIKCVVRNNFDRSITILGETIDPKGEKELSFEPGRMVTITDSEDRVEPTCECVHQDTTLIDVTQYPNFNSLRSVQKTTRPLIIRKKEPYGWDFLISAEGSTPTFNQTVAFPIEKQTLTIEIAASIKKILLHNAQRSTRPNNDGTTQTTTFSEYGNRWYSRVDGSTILEDDTDGLLIEGKSYEEQRGQDEMWKIKQLQLMEKNRVQQ